MSKATGDGVRKAAKMLSYKLGLKEKLEYQNRFFWIKMEPDKRNREFEERQSYSPHEAHTVVQFCLKTH